MSDTCATEQKLHAVTEANKMLVAEVERLEEIITLISNTTIDDDTVTICLNALEISNDR